MMVQIDTFIWVTLAAVFISIFTYLLLPGFARRLKRNGIVGKDLHKHSKPRIAERGGIILMLSFAVFISIVYFLTRDVLALYALAVSLAFGLYGLWDDMKQSGKYQKLLVSTAIAIGALVLSGFPGLVWIPLLILLIAVSNIFNLFAGFNGLEIGCSSIVSFFFALSCLLLGKTEAFYLSFGVFFILIAFLAHNKYPAKIFPGNVGTLLIGGFFSSLALYYNLFVVLIPLLSIYILDVVLKGWSAGYFSRSEKIPTMVNGDGTLVSGGDYLSLPRFILRFKSLTEKKLVSLVWKLEIAVGGLTLFLVILGTA